MLAERDPIEACELRVLPSRWRNTIAFAHVCPRVCPSSPAQDDVGIAAEMTNGDSASPRGRLGAAGNTQSGRDVRLRSATLTRSHWARVVARTAGRASGAANRRERPVGIV